MPHTQYTQKHEGLVEYCLPTHILGKLSQNDQITDLRYSLLDFKDKEKSSGLQGKPVKLLKCVRKLSFHQSFQESHTKEGSNSMMFFGKRVIAGIIS